MLRRLLLSLLFLMQVYIMPSGIAQATDFIVHVPDEQIEEGLRWHQYYSKHKDSNILKNKGTSQERAQYFLDNCVFDPSLQWARDFFIVTVSWGKIKSFDSSGIRVEVKS